MTAQVDRLTAAGYWLFVTSWTSCNIHIKVKTDPSTFQLEALRLQTNRRTTCNRSWVFNITLDQRWLQPAFRLWGTSSMTVNRLFQRLSQKYPKISLPTEIDVNDVSIGKKVPVWWVAVHWLSFRWKTRLVEPVQTNGCPKRRRPLTGGDTILYNRSGNKMMHGN